MDDGGCSYWFRLLKPMPVVGTVAAVESGVMLYCSWNLDPLALYAAESYAKGGAVDAVTGGVEAIEYTVDGGC